MTKLETSSVATSISMRRITKPITVAPCLAMAEGQCPAQPARPPATRVVPGTGCSTSLPGGPQFRHPRREHVREGRGCARDLLVHDQDRVGDCDRDPGQLLHDQLLR